MKIKKITKQKGNTYLVELDNESIILYEDILLKYEILLRKTISPNMFLEMKKENQEYACTISAIKFLGKKLRSKKEMMEYLKRKEFASDEIDETIKKLEQQNYLNDMEYAKAYLHDRLRFSNDGPENIRKKLNQLGISEDQISHFVDQVEKSVWEKKINEIIEKKMETNHRDSIQNVKHKLVQYFLQNGYPYEMFINEINAIKKENSEDILNQEKEKLWRKLSRKYEGETLIFQVKNKLFQKGFTKEEIDTLF